MRASNPFGTLAILVMVVAVGVPVAVRHPEWLCSNQAAKHKACANHRKNIATAYEMYSTDHLGKYPASADSVRPYLKEWPNCPFDGTPYDCEARIVTDASKPTLACGGEDFPPGTLVYRIHCRSELHARCSGTLQPWICPRDPNP